MFRGLLPLHRLLRNTCIIAATALLIPSGAAAAFSVSVPRLGLNAPISYHSLKRGPMVYYQDRDTLALAGHRTTYTKPFANIHKLRKGNLVIVKYNRHRNVYRVDGIRIIRAGQIRPLLRYRGLVMSACHPPGSAAYRYVVLARLVRS